MAAPSPAELFAPGTEGVWRDAEALRGSADARDVERLRRAHPQIPPPVVSAIVTQQRLRARARRDFGAAADSMLFTAEGLQQSTRPVVAVRRARQLELCGATSVLDLGCGIGADSMAFQRAGLLVTAYELDAATAAIAAHNLQQPVLGADFTTARLPAEPAAFLDPARRGAGGRRLAPESWRPPWSWITAFAAGRPATAVKAAPGLPHADIPDGAAAEWVSVAGSLVETCVWFPGLANGMPRRRAVLITPGADPWQPEAADTVELSAEGAGAPAWAGAPGEWLLEPDAAVIRSHLIDVLADRLGARLLSPGIAYLTADTPPDRRFGQRFRVIAEVPAGARSLRRELRSRGVGRVEIHTRGLGIDPAALRRALSLGGGGPVRHLVLTRVAGRPAGFLVEPDPRPRRTTDR